MGIYCIVVDISAATDYMDSKKSLVVRIENDKVQYDGTKQLLARWNPEIIS